MKNTFQEKSFIQPKPTYVREGFISKYDSGSQSIEHDRVQPAIPTSPGVC